MNIFILANGGSEIGMGHIMRTLVLAKELNKNFDITYVITDKKEYKAGVKKVKLEGFKYIYENKFLENLTSKDILIIDRYDLTEKNLKFYKLKLKLLILFDDNNLNSYYDVNLLLNQNLHAVDLKYIISDKANVLCGGKYSLLRDDILQNKPIEINYDIQNILLTIGGSDNLNLTHKILKEIKYFNSTINVVIGPSFKYRESLKREYCSYNNMIFYENADMGKLMSKCDLAISACGSTIYELCYLGIPTIALIIADNQKLLGKFLGENEIVILSSIEDILHNIKSIDLEKRKKLSVNMKSLIDGKGKYRVVKEIEKLIESEE